MRRDILTSLKEALAAAVKRHYAVELTETEVEIPPRPELGDLAFTFAFDLARKAKRAPRQIAEELAPLAREVEGVERVEVAGGGYLNVYLDRGSYLREFCAQPEPEPIPSAGKIIVEHTNINPNKAAHIGHLRNAALGDTFVRVLRYRGETVEVQNYIDDTGVQVADVVVGFLDLEGMDLPAVRAIDGSRKFDYFCWDLYARVTDYYASDPARQGRREQALKAIEEGKPPEAPLASHIATRIVRLHLQTMERIGVRYDLLPWEGDILRLRFWEKAFALLKEKKAIRLAREGKNAGCWVMDLPEEDQGGASDEKVIVRSNGTVTYVGKDIAYHLWKLGLVPKDFAYRRFYTYPDGATVWATTSESGDSDAPVFGRGSRVYNVIDSRQSYPQQIVQLGVARISSEEARSRLRHFAYEMVALSPATCRELGFPVSEQDSAKPYVEVSGRKGLGVKADDLIDALEERARAEVDRRNPDLPEEARREMAHAIAQGALRYFMIKYTKNKIIAFDFAEALNFEGDSGPYLQYAVVRANNIFQKMGLGRAQGPLKPPPILTEGEAWKALEPEESAELWSLAFTASRLPEVAEQICRAEEPAFLARFALQLAQKFNAIYHRYPILREPDPTRQAIRLFVVDLFRRQMTRSLELMGIPVPARM